jgi:hypothetical protein
MFQSKNFKYIRYEISYENENNIQQKAAKCAQIRGILNETFKQILVQKVLISKVYNALVLPFLLYGREIWTLSKKKDTKCLTSIGVKFFRTTAG